MNSADEKLWAYIDGLCTDDERKAIEQLIATDEAFARKYHELLNFDAELTAVEPDEPPMAFTYNVMEAIRAEEARNPLKAGINKNIIRGITIFFIISIAAIFVFTLTNISWQSAGDHTGLAVNFTLPDMKRFANADVVKGFVFFDVVLALFLFDAWLRRKNVAKQV